MAASMDASFTQTTAPVLEFRCLYTTDLRRKQKRWQDGRLKFHTFNKRVMVYDERSNFMGDTHWRKEYEFDDGEELQLERGGIMVEVGECIGKRDQDLTNLVDKRWKERKERVAAKHAASPMEPQPSLNLQTPAGSALLKPKTLNAVLGKATGHYGQAVIPKLSPFEQRHQADRDENSNDRPAKRRKQDDTPPSKNGYGESPVGTKVALAFSKLPSTSSLKYAPFRASFQRTPAATIDLTGEEDDRTVPKRVRPNTNKDKRTGNKSQYQRLQKSPPSRSGYANSLMGASLSLNQPESFAPKKTGLGLRHSAKGVFQAENPASSSSLDSTSLREDEVAEERHMKRIQTQKKPINKRTEPVPGSPILFCSSSPPVMSQVTSVSKSTIVANQDDVPQDYYVSCLTNRPVSALRIKSRGPRKMMMFMERPISRPHAPTESSDDTQTEPRKLQSPKLVPQEAGLSQATLRLDVFRERQQQRLQDRLDGKRPNVDWDGESSSPIDVGINLRMIDSLQSRKTKMPRMARSDATAEVQQQTTSLDLEGVSEDDEAPQVSSQATTSEDADVTSNAIALASNSSSLDSHRSNHTSTDTQKQRHQPSSIPGVLQRSTIPSSDAISSVAPSPAEAQKPIPPQTYGNSGSATTDIGSSPSDTLITKKNMEGNVTTSLVHGSISEWTTPPISVKQLEQSLEVNVRENMASKRAPGTLQWEKESSKVRNSPTVCEVAPLRSQPIANAIIAADERDLCSNPPNAALGPQVERTTPTSEMQNLIPTNSPSGRSGDSLLPAHFSRATTSTTMHLGSIIKCSASPSNQPVEQLADLAPPFLSPASVFEVQKEESISGEVVIEASSKPSPPLVEGLSSGARGDEAVVFAKGIENTSGPTIPPVPDARTIPPKKKLVNPATRGPSVQMTASKTVNALVPTSNGLSGMPPPPHNSIWRTLAKNESVAGRVKESVKEVTQGGPWSRESFDLFGTWRPPGRPTGTSPVKS